MLVDTIINKCLVVARCVHARLAATVHYSSYVARCMLYEVYIDLKRKIKLLAILISWSSSKLAIAVCYFVKFANPLSALKIFYLPS